MKSEIYYFDDRERMVPKEKATHAIIREYDESGNFRGETFVKLGSVQRSAELSEEDLRLIAEFDAKYGAN